jgi:membrane protein implicated in regulation of membrane protease activity
MAAPAAPVTTYVAAFFALGLAAMVAGGVAWGFDATAVVLLALAVAVALVGVAVARKFATGTAEPAQCATCGGVIAPSSPYCKHCGTPR